MSVLEYVTVTVPVEICTNGCSICRFESAYNCLLFQQKIDLRRCPQCVEAVEKAKKEVVK